jgi:cell division transport system ATP-binding protein
MYSRGLYALHDLSLSIKQGEFVFLTGPSGAGKSTFLRMLLMQERPTSGELAVNGQNLANLKRREIQEYRRSLGFVFQDFKLIPTRTLLENVSFVPEVIGVSAAQQRRRAFQVLKWVLADEPTGNLDPDLSLEIMNLLREVNAGGTTVVVATHDRELIRLVGRRTVTLEQGKVVEIA